MSSQLDEEFDQIAEKKQAELLKLASLTMKQYNHSVGESAKRTSDHLQEELSKIQIPK